jgi:hypothetical protein
MPPDGGGDGGERSAGAGAAPGETRKEPRKQVGSAQPEPHDDGGDEDDGGSVTEPHLLSADRPHLISARLIGGGTKVTAGDKAVPIQPTFALLAGYPIPVAPKLTVEAGAVLTFTAVPYDKSGGTMVGSKATGQMWGLLANAGVTYEVIPKLGVRLDAGLGALFFANIDESPFTGGMTTSGALSMFHIRGGVSAEYAVTPNVVLTLAPIAFTYSPPKEGLTKDIKSITSIDFAMVGIGYRK